MRTGVRFEKEAMRCSIRRALQNSIEKEIHSSPNRACYSMNNTLIAIGTYIDALHKEALEAAKRIGKVEVTTGPKVAKHLMHTLTYLSLTRAGRRKHPHHIES